jgi:hypothetical protein
MTAPRSPPTSWRALLARAVDEPGLVHEAYTRFHTYSLHNQLLALCQCLERGIAPGPLRTSPGWLSLGRSVRKGEKALVLCTPITRHKDDEDVVVGFSVRARWFTLAQTDGEPYEDASAATWSEARMLADLHITRVAFAHLDGNVQGYALSGRQVAISPVAGLPHKTLFHEVGHVLLGHPDDQTTPRPVREAEAEAVALLCCEALGLSGAEYARGYLQHWLAGQEFSEESAQRAIQAAQQILRSGGQHAGQEPPS